MNATTTVGYASRVRQHIDFSEAFGLSTIGSYWTTSHVAS